MDNGIGVDKGIGEGHEVAVGGTGLEAGHMGIGGHGKVVVPGTPDRSIRVTDGNGGGGIVADDGIGSTDAYTGSGVHPDYNSCIN